MERSERSEPMAVESEPLFAFVQRARTATNPAMLIGAILEFARLVSGAVVCGVVLQTRKGREVRLAGAPARLISQYTNFAESEGDPLSSALGARHGVVRSNELFTEADWHRHPFRREVLAPFGIDAAMVAEVTDASARCGVIAVGRMVGCQPFSPSDALRLQTMALHASVAATRIDQEDHPTQLWDALSARQQQLVRLVANGLTNVQVAHACGLSTHAVKKALERMFEKASVSSRTELIAALGVRAHS